MRSTGACTRACGAREPCAAVGGTAFGRPVILLGVWAVFVAIPTLADGPFLMKQGSDSQREQKEKSINGYQCSAPGTA